MTHSITETHLDFYQRWGKLAEPYFEWQYRQFAPYLGRRIADIGCGLGNFTRFFDRAELYVGLETDPEIYQKFQRQHQSAVIKLAKNNDITTPEAVAELQNDGIDSILCVNVLEHIENDRRALSHMVEAVSKGGHVCLLVPALSWLYGSLDRLDGHYRRYAKEDLTALAAQENVEIIQCYYMNFIGVFGWFLKGRILKEKTHSNKNYEIMNLLLPWVSAIEARIKPPLGMSLVLVLRKK